VAPMATFDFVGGVYGQLLREKLVRSKKFTSRALTRCSGTARFS
jgi:hypothetical protein